jgi:hypothetical protein
VARPAGIPHSASFHIRPRYVAISAAAIVCLGTSVYLDLVSHGVLRGPILTPIEILDATASFTRELGFALIIALMISVGIEAQARAEDVANAEAMRKMIAIDVFKGVLSSRLPREYADRVVELHLYPLVIREHLEATIHVDRLPTGLAKQLGARSRNLRLLHSTYRYRLRNLSTGSHVHNLVMSIPRRSGDLADLSRLVSARIGDRQCSPDELVAAGSVDQAESSTVYSWEIPLQTDGTVQVEIETVIVKEASDRGMGDFASHLAGCLRGHFEPSTSAIRCFEPNSHRLARRRFVHLREEMGGEWSPAQER